MRVCSGEIFFLSWILETLKEVDGRVEGGNLPAVSRRWGDGPHKSSLGIGHSRWCLCPAPAFVVGAQLCFLTESFGASYFTCLSLTFLSCEMGLIAESASNKDPIRKWMKKKEKRKKMNECLADWLGREWGVSINGPYYYSNGRMWIWWGYLYGQGLKPDSQIWGSGINITAWVMLLFALLKNFKALRESESHSVVCPLCDPMDYTVHGILRARILEWVAFPFSRGSS